MNISNVLNISAYKYNRSRQRLKSDNKASLIINKRRIFISQRKINSHRKSYPSIEIVSSTKIFGKSFDSGKFSHEQIPNTMIAAPLIILEYTVVRFVRDA